jgi:hypothetical protein
MESTRFFALAAAMLVAGVCMGGEITGYFWNDPININVSQAGPPHQGSYATGFTVNDQGKNHDYLIWIGAQVTGAVACVDGDGLWDDDYWCSVELGDEVGHAFTICAKVPDEVIDDAFWMYFFVDIAGDGDWDIGDYTIDAVFDINTF